MPLPALRALDIFPIEREGRTYFCLKDPQGLADKVALLTTQQFFIAACLNGRAEPADIAAIFAERFQDAVLKTSDIEKAAAVLDENLFLDSSKFREHLGRVKKEYARLTTRPAAFAGSGYEADPIALARRLEACFEPPGPGRIPDSRQGDLVGLVAPHIDFGRGGSGYAWAYREIPSAPSADLYVIFGVAHAGIGLPFALSLKDYETPFGKAPVDRDLGRAFVREAGRDVLEHELAHRTEHSIEFQAVWLRYRTRESNRSFKILPILCSSFSNGNGSVDSTAQQALECLEVCLKNYQGRACLVAGVDLAHVGPRFGDEEPVDKLIGPMEAGDRASLDRVLAKDAEGFYRSVMEDGGKRKVCGLGALYAFTWLLKRLHPNAQGRLLYYSHAPDPAGGEVSFASMAFYENLVKT